jgi:hypothetical protein
MGMEGLLLGGVKQPGLEADSSPPSNAEVKNKWLYLHSLVCLHGMCRDNFTFTCYQHVLASEPSSPSKTAPD